MLSIIVPVYNEIALLADFLRHAGRFSGDLEWVLVDDASDDGSGELLERFVRAGAQRRLVRIERRGGIAPACNAGAAQARGETLWFLPVDCRAPQDAPELIRNCLRDATVAGGGFDKRYQPRGWALRLGELYLNQWRFGVFRQLVSTNGIFVRREIFEALGGFSEHGFLDDLIFSGRLKRRGKIARVRRPLLVSARRYQRDGTLRRIAKNLLIVFLFRLGVSIPRLKKYYSGKA